MTIFQGSLVFDGERSSPKLNDTEMRKWQPCSLRDDAITCRHTVVSNTWILTHCVVCVQFMVWCIWWSSLPFHRWVSHDLFWPSKHILFPGGRQREQDRAKHFSARASEFRMTCSWLPRRRCLEKMALDGQMRSCETRLLLHGAACQAGTQSLIDSHSQT